MKNTPSAASPACRKRRLMGTTGGSAPPRVYRAWKPVTLPLLLGLEVELPPWLRPWGGNTPLWPCSGC